MAEDADELQTGVGSLETNVEALLIRSMLSAGLSTSDLLDAQTQSNETVANALEPLNTPRCRKEIARDIDDQA